MNDLINDFELAKNAMRNSYSPHSNYKVGAVLTTKSGKKYTGCNVENHGIQSICAERVAFTKAISEGERSFEKIVIVGGKNIEEIEKCLPCGYCRQFMSEFVSSDFKIYAIDGKKILEYSMEELLPHSFKF